VAGGHRHVAHAHQAHAPGHAGTVDARHQRHGAGLGHAQQLRQVAMRLGVVGGEGLGGLQVGPGTKRLAARAGDDDGADLALRLCRRNGLRHACQYRVAHGVAPFLARDGEPQHRATGFDLEFGGRGAGGGGSVHANEGGLANIGNRF